MCKTQRGLDREAGSMRGPRESCGEDPLLCTLSHLATRCVFHIRARFTLPATLPFGPMEMRLEPITQKGNLPATHGVVIRRRP